MYIEILVILEHIHMYVCTGSAERFGEKTTPFKKSLIINLNKVIFFTGTILLGSAKIG